MAELGWATIYVISMVDSKGTLSTSTKGMRMFGGGLLAAGLLSMGFGRRHFSLVDKYDFTRFYLI
jgi:hypothetical protein